MRITSQNGMVTFDYEQSGFGFDITIPNDDGVCYLKAFAIDGDAFTIGKYDSAKDAEMAYFKIMESYYMGKSRHHVGF